MATAVHIFELRGVAGDDASLPGPCFFLVHCRDKVARMQMEISSHMLVLDELAVTLDVALTIDSQ